MPNRIASEETVGIRGLLSPGRSPASSRTRELAGRIEEFLTQAINQASNQAENRSGATPPINEDEQAIGSFRELTADHNRVDFPNLRLQHALNNREVLRQVSAIPEHEEETVSENPSELDFERFVREVLENEERRVRVEEIRREFEENYGPQPEAFWRSLESHIPLGHGAWSEETVTSPTDTGGGRSQMTATTNPTSMNTTLQEANEIERFMQDSEIARGQDEILKDLLLNTFHNLPTLRALR